MVRAWRAGRPVDLRATLGPLGRGAGDPTFRIGADGSVWRTTRTPDGPATVRLGVRPAEGIVVSRSWGPGAPWAAEGLPALLGARDDPSGFDPSGLPGRLRETWRRYGPGWRVPVTGRVLEALVAAVLEQKVTGVESRRAWRSLLAHAGDAAPGPAPAGMRVFPPPEAWRRIPSWTWHRAGVDHARATTILRLMQAPGRMEQAADLAPADARARLLTIPGVGPWTAAETAQRALGDADAVSFGDYHLAHHVVFALTGGTDGDDEAMRALLEPYAGHRYRVQRIVELSGIGRPARGPRLPVRDHRAI